MASSSTLDLGNIVTSAAGLLLHRRRGVPSAAPLRGRSGSGRCGLAFSSNGAAAQPPLRDSEKKGPVVTEIPLEDIRRPLMRTRANDPAKVKELMDSIRVIGLQVPIDVLEVDGVYYGTLLISQLPVPNLYSHTQFPHAEAPTQIFRVLWMPPVRGAPAARAPDDPVQSSSRHKGNPEVIPIFLDLGLHIANWNDLH